MDCDVCQRTLTDAEAVNLEPEVIREATDRGFVPPRTPALDQLAAEAGISTRDAWLRVVAENDDQPWTVCQDCHVSLTTGTKPQSDDGTTLCSFCKSREANPNFSAEQVLHKRNDDPNEVALAAVPLLMLRSGHGQTRMVTSQYLKTCVQIPQCKKCYWAHALPSVTHWLLGLSMFPATIAFTFLIVMVVKNDWDPGALGTTVLLGTLAILGLCVIFLVRLRFGATAKRIADVSTHPRIHALRQSGWHRGESPVPSSTFTVPHWLVWPRGE